MKLDESYFKDTLNDTEDSQSELDELQEDNFTVMYKFAVSVYSDDEMQEELSRYIDRLFKQMNCRQIKNICLEMKPADENSFHEIYVEPISNDLSTLLEIYCVLYRTLYTFFYENSIISKRKMKTGPIGLCIIKDLNRPLTQYKSFVEYHNFQVNRQYNQILLNKQIIRKHFNPVTGINEFIFTEEEITQYENLNYQAIRWFHGDYTKAAREMKKFFRGATPEFSIVNHAMCSGGNCWTVKKPLEYTVIEDDAVKFELDNIVAKNKTEAMLFLDEERPNYMSRSIMMQHARIDWLCELIKPWNHTWIYNSQSSFPFCVMCGYRGSGNSYAYQVIALVCNEDVQKFHEDLIKKGYSPKDIQALKKFIKEHK